MWIVQLALKRPYTFLVLALFIAISGSLAAVRTPIDIFPSINIPVVSVVWTYSGLLPKDMSDRVVYCYENVTSPPSETASDLGDFHCRHGEAPRSRKKDGKWRLVYAGWDDTKVVRPDGCGQARKGGGRANPTPPQGGAMTPPSKN